jgi:hypothetical protein
MVQDIVWRIQNDGDVHMLRFLALMLATAAAGAGPAVNVQAIRFAENPLITQSMSATIGDNVNGPTVIRVPSWVDRPLGRYYMYFAHHKGQFIRLAYANSLRGPWKIHEPGVMKVEDSAFFRPQPDPVDSPSGFYTHIASPEIYVDQANKRIIMWTHGVWTEGKRWPENRAEAQRWLQQSGYYQYSQASVSSDGLNFKPQPAISRQSYLRVFKHDGTYYAISRLGQLLRASDPLQEFELGPNPFRDKPFSNRVRHVALLEDGDTLNVFFSVIGDAPESIQYTTIRLQGDWNTWTAGDISPVLTPQAPYECLNLPNEPSAVGEIDHPARQLRDPAVFSEEGKISLFYTFCGEQGVAGAEVKISR